MPQQRHAKGTPLSPLAYTGGVQASAAPEPTVRAPSPALLREPLTWAALAALLGSAVALAGTLSWLGWESVLSRSPGPIPVPPWLASWGPPSGDLLAALSLLGVYRLLEGRSWAAIAGGVVLLLRLAASASFVLWSALRLPGQVPASGEVPLAPFVLLQASLWLGPTATLLLALGVLLAGGDRRLGAVLLGLTALGQPLVFVFDALPGEAFYLSGATVFMLGWPSGGIALPEAVLFALLALLLLRGARQRALGRLWGRITRENGEKARRLYVEGLGRGDLSALKDVASEDFRDLRHGEHGKRGMERVVLRLRGSFPDLAVSVKGQEADRDLVRTRLTLSGTDRGGVMWYPPTGRRVAFSAAFEDRFSGGRLVEHGGGADTQGLLRQLGHHEQGEPSRQ
jgi:predicted ester cyclase